MLHAARDTGIQVIWDLCHYGWPDDIDVFQPEFVERFSAFGRAFVAMLLDETGGVPYITPMNEISFLAWGGGDHGFINPFAINRGADLKRQLVLATIAAIKAIRTVAPHARFVQVDPVINVVTGVDASELEKKAAAAYTLAQFEANDAIAGRVWPELGGDPNLLDIIGANYYVHNQWELEGLFIERSDPRYRPLSQLLNELYSRYRRPLFIAETGIEDERRPAWLRYVVDEIIDAINNGVPVEGICLYPVVNHPGWVDDRHCHNGLWDYCNEQGHREIYKPLAEELRLQAARIEQAVRNAEAKQVRPHAPPQALQNEDAGAGASF
jgi:hypothetical protein